MNLQESGFRYLHIRETGEFKWAHPEVIAYYGQTCDDCTDMNDDEFDAFVAKASA